MIPCWLIILNHLCAYSSSSCVLTFFFSVCSISLVLDWYSSFYWIIFFCLRLSVKSYYNQYHFLSIGKSLWVEWSSSNSGSSEEDQCVWAAAWERGGSHMDLSAHTHASIKTHTYFIQEDDPVRTVLTLYREGPSTPSIWPHHPATLTLPLKSTRGKQKKEK